MCRITPFTLTALANFPQFVIVLQRFVDAPQKAVVCIGSDYFVFQFEFHGTTS
jgi:hypothetical protein